MSIKKTRGLAAVVLASVVFNVGWVIWTAAISVLGICLLPIGGGFDITRWWALGSLWWLRVICHVRIESQGLENVPQDGAVLASRHETAADPMILAALVARSAFVMKIELRKIPLFGFLCRFHHVFVDRGTGGRATRLLLTAAQRMLSCGRNLVLFPQGTRIPGSRYRGVIHPGAALLYRHSNKPVIPVTLDSHRWWKGFLKYAGVITVRFGSPLPPGLPRQEFEEALCSAIEPREQGPLLAILYNNKSGRGARERKRAAQMIDEMTLATGWTIQWCELRDRALLRKAPDRLMIIGGDGTVRAACRLVIDRDWNCGIGLVRGGTGNNLSSALGISVNLREALERILNPAAPTVAVDVVEMVCGDGDREIFVQSACLGFPAMVSGWFATLRRNKLGKLSILLLGEFLYRFLAIGGLGVQKLKVMLSVETLKIGREFEGRHCWQGTPAVFMAGDGTLGGGFIPCPKASLFDGLLDVCWVGPEPSYRRLFKEMSTGEHLSNESINYEQHRVLEFNVDPPTRILLDGDLTTEAYSHYSFSVVAARLKFVCGHCFGTAARGNP